MNKYQRKLRALLRKGTLLKQAVFFSLLEKKRLKKFRGCHRGKSCWVIGNGPSLNQTNVMALNQEVTFVVNGFVLHEEFEKFKPTFYVATNPRLMHSEFLKYDVMPRLQKTGTICFLNLEAKKRIGHPFREVYYLLSTEHPLILDGGYNLDITGLLLGTRVSTIIQAVIPIAVYMGFTTIFLVGCDSDYGSFDHESAHFYKGRIPPSLWKLIGHAQKLYPDYYEHLEQSRKEYRANSRNEYDLTSEYMEDLGVKIYNCTVGGKLETFPRRRLEDVLEEQSNSQVLAQHTEPLSSHPTIGQTG
jgi:hypothetical protein